MTTYDADTSTAVTVAISCGQVRGFSRDGVERYLGIPYAAAPVGDRRFALPQPSPAWDGVRDALRPGPTAPQSNYAGALARILPTVVVPGDDFLNLNVCTPSSRGDGLLPVMVWFHGGSLQHGSNALSGYDGSAFARDGVVFVAPNYRLGAEGFSVLDGAPLNLGIADQLAALRWVQAEIARFGGDPRRVTVFGQSAGGNTISALLAHRDAPELMSRAIIQSGPLTALPLDKAGKITRLMAKDLGIPATREAFMGVTPEALLAAQARVTAGSTPISGGAGYAIAIDPSLVPVNPQDALEAGHADGIPLMIGTTTEEARLWLVPTGLVHKIKRLHLAVARRKTGISAGAVKLFRRNRPGASAGEILGALATDKLLRVPTNQVSDARLSHGATGFVYEFSWPSPVEDLGAAHAVELGFVFDNVALPDSIGLAGPDAPQALATEMHRAWVDFATTGHPGWQPWSAQRPVKMFDGDANPVVFAPRDDERRATTPLTAHQELA
jgi:para-nitrobenzyl esterase